MKKNKNLRVTVLELLLVLGLIVPLAVLAAGPVTVNLGSAGNYVILAKTGVSTTGATSVVGDIGLSPAAASYVTGFDLILPAASIFSTSALVTGKIYAPGYADPTPANLTTAVSDMETAYTDAMGRAASVTELGAGNIGGLTLTPGVYKWGTGVTIPTDVTLSGGANDVWIFQIAQNLDISSATKVVLAGGAQAKNIFWVVAGQTTVGTTAVMNGNILDQTAIVLNTGAILNGRALAQTAVTLDSNAVTAPISAASTPAPATPSTPAVSATPSSSTSSNISTTPPTSPEVVASTGSVKAATSATSAAVHVFKTNLTVGSLGNEVKSLQKFLNAHGYTVAVSGAGSSGNETTRFGAATKAALMKFQKAHNITPAVGYFGLKTRTAINNN